MSRPLYRDLLASIQNMRQHERIPEGFSGLEGCRILERAEEKGQKHTFFGEGDV